MRKEYISADSIRKTVRMWLPNTRIVYENVDQPRTSGNGTIYLPYPSSEFSKEERALYFYKAWHEKEHNRKGKNDWVKYGEKNKGIFQGWYGFMHNLALDMMNDYVNHDEYEGVRECIGIGRVLHFDRCEKDVEKKPISDYDCAADAMWTFMNASMGDWCPSMSYAHEHVLKSGRDPQVLEWYNLLMDKGYGEKFRNCTETEERVKLLNYVITEEFKLELPPQNEEESRAENGGGEGEGGGKDEEGDSVSKRAKEAYVKYKDLIFHDHDGDSLSYSPLHISYEGVTPTFEKWYGKEIDEMNLDKYPVDTMLEGYINKTFAESSGNLTKKVRRLLNHLSLKKWDYDKKNGVFDTQRMYKIASHKDGTDKFKKIFKKPSQIITPEDTAVFLLVDCSGSMGGSKYFHAAVAATRLAEAIVPLRVSLCVGGFTQSSNTQHFWFKRWQDRFSVSFLLKNFARIPNMGGNVDGDSILFAYENLKKRNEEKKILIVLSDGQPAGGGRGGDLVGWTANVIKMIEKSSVSLYAIGLMDRNVERLYRNRVVIDNISDLEPKLLTVIKTQIVQGYS